MIESPRLYTQRDSKRVPLVATRTNRFSLSDLLDNLNHPIVWVNDEYLGAWLPVEVPENATAAQLLELTELPKNRIPLAQLKESWDRDGYVKVPGFVNKHIAEMLTKYYEKYPDIHNTYPEMTGINRTSINNLDLMRYYHEATPKLMRELVGEKVIPSYSFSSKYLKGSSLPAHIDNRPACTWNISLPLAASDNSKLSSWPLTIETKTGEHVVELEAGDAVCYGGTRDRHWRDVMPEELDWVFGVFFHYAPADYRGSLD